MSTLNPILAGSAQSVEAYQQVIEQTSQAVVQWLKQPEMYQGKSVDELRERISLEFNEQGLGNQAAIDRAIRVLPERQPVGASPAVRGAPALPEPGD